MYVGGAGHALLPLLYARFCLKVSPPSYKTLSTLASGMVLFHDGVVAICTVCVLSSITRVCAATLVRRLVLGF